MKSSLGVWLIVAAAGIAVSAQQLAPTAPLSRDTLAVPGQPTTPPPGWTLLASDAATTASPASVQRYGPGVRITTLDEGALFRPAFPLTGDGVVSAVVFVDATTPPAYGLTLGGETGRAFLVRAAGAVAIAPLQNRKAVPGTWTSAPAVATTSTRCRSGSKCACTASPPTWRSTGSWSRRPRSPPARSTACPASTAAARATSPWRASVCAPCSGRGRRSDRIMRAPRRVGDNGRTMVMDRACGSREPVRFFLRTEA